MGFNLEKVVRFLLVGGFLALFLVRCSDGGTTTPMGKLVFQVTGAFAEFERTMIRQRIEAGLKRASKTLRGITGFEVTVGEQVDECLAEAVTVLSTLRSVPVSQATPQP